MYEVKTDRNIWKDLVLWRVVTFVLSLIVWIIASVKAVKNFSGSIFSVGTVVAGLIELGWIIYLIYYFCKLVNDLNIVCAHVQGDEEENSWNYILVWLLGKLTLGAYSVYWIYKQGGRLNLSLKRYGIESQETGTIYFLWSTIGLLFGGGFITYYLLIKNLNKACIAYTNGNYGEGSNENKMNENSYGVGTDEEEYDYEEDDDVTKTTPVLVGISGEYEGQELNISSGEEIVMGRDAQKCNLVFTSENVSKIHCRITFNFKENVYYVTDYSKNGVLAGGKALAKNMPQRVSRGTRISFAENEVFQLR